MQCQGYSCEPSRRGSGLPAHPGISSLVRRGASRRSNSLHLTVCVIVTPCARTDSRPFRPTVSASFTSSGERHRPMHGSVVAAMVMVMMVTTNDDAPGTNDDRPVVMMVVMTPVAVMMVVLLRDLHVCVRLRH